MYFYSDTAPKSNVQIDIWRMNANKAYMRHFDNFLFLDFIAKNGTFQERSAVEKEIIICRRKMKFWERHPNFEAEYVQKEKERRIKDWRSNK